MPDEVTAIIIVGSVLLVYVTMRIMSGSSSKEKLSSLNTDISKETTLKLLSGRFKIFTTLFILAFLLSAFHLWSFYTISIGGTIIITFLVNVVLLVASAVSYVRYTKMRGQVESLYYGNYTYKSFAGLISTVMFVVTIIFLVIASLPIIFFIYMGLTGQVFPT